MGFCSRAKEKILMKTQPLRGSHLPCLMKAVKNTVGPIVEIGTGMYSTTFLHWFCYASKRPLVSYEDNPRWIGFAQQFEADFHKVIFVEDYGKIDLSQPWSVALIDHDAIDGRKRWQDAERVTHAEYVVCHDAEGRSDRKYGYSKIVGLYRWRYEYADAYPHTAVFSNLHDLTGWKPE